MHESEKNASVGVERTTHRKKRKHLDRLTRDAIAAQEAGMSYGKWKALHPHTPDEDDEEDQGPAVGENCEVAICEHCGERFVKFKYQKNKRFCCVSCQSCHNSAKRHAEKKRNKPGKTVVCRICGADFVTEVHNRIYCSTECYAEGQRRRNLERYQEQQKKAPKKLDAPRQKGVCAICGITFTPTNGNNIYCSPKCYAENHNRINREWYARNREKKEAAKNGSN